jgi:DNA-binding NarL/FixJ family response regulator
MSRDTVLISDGDENCRSLISDLLERVGYRTIEAESGQEVLSTVLREAPTLVLLEVELPGVSGYELCHELRQKYGDELPIILMSESRTEPPDRVAGLLLGADDYVVKPFDGRELLARVRRLMDHQRAHHEEPPVEGGRLTDREREILALLSEGLRSKAIAKQLVISPKAVSTHIQRILTKLDVHSRAEAVSLALRHGLVTVTR